MTTKPGYCACGARLTEDEVEAGACHVCGPSGKARMQAYNMRHHGMLLLRVGQEAYWSEFARDMLATHAMGRMITGRDADRMRQFVDRLDAKRAQRARS